MPVTVLRRALTSVVAAALVLLAGPRPATAAAAPIVKYYVVTSSYQGQPEFLYEIAQRYLGGNGNRSSEIFALNKGRLEPDGATVADPTRISPGWILQLPTDATGDGVIYGVLPVLHFDPSGTTVKYCWIGNTYQGKPDTLAMVAQRFLGTQNRAGDVFTLNRGRLEPDGGTLNDPAKLTPGWFVKLPGDAKGDGLISGPLPFLGAAPPAGQASAPASSAASASASQSSGSATASGSASASASQSASAPASAPSAAAASSSSSSSSLPLILGIVLAVLVVAGGIWWALRAGLFSHRRSGKPGPAAPRDDAASWTIDRVLRTLATSCARLGRPVPGVAAVVIGTATITLRLARPDEQAPDGWTAEDQGRSWSAPLRLLQSAAVDDELPAPYPRLVSVGDSDQGRVLLNLAEAHGLISLEGDSRLTRPLAADWVRELSGSPWSRGTTVLRIGFGSNAEDLPGVEDAPSIEAASATLDETDAGVLVLAHAPGGREPERVTALAGAGDGRWSVLVLGSPKNAGWRLVAASDGTLDTGLLAEPVRLHGKRPLEHA